MIHEAAENVAYYSLDYLRGRSIAFYLCLCIPTIWLLWWVCRFVFQPIIYRNEPIELPYWIPVLGHGRAFYRNADELITEARHYFSNSRRPFALTLGATKLYILTNPKDVMEAWKNVSTLSIDIFFKELLFAAGASKQCCRQMLERPSESGRAELFFNPRDKSVSRLSKDLHNQQLLPGSRLEDVVDEFMKSFVNGLKLQSIVARPYNRVQSGTKDKITIPLFQWISELFVEVGQSVYFGEKLAQIDPNFVTTLLKFDYLSWQLLYQLPHLLCREVHSARIDMIESLTTYFDCPYEQRKGNVWFTEAYEKELRASGMESKDVAVVFLLIAWGINSNVHKSCYWLLCYVIRDSNLVNAVREEVKPAMRTDGIDYKYIESQCPQLNAVFYEVTRLASSAQSVRFITEDTVIGGKLLRKNNRLMIPLRQLHFDESVFGPVSLDLFDPDRFLRDNKLAQSTSWRPFGGGITQCPGRHLAKLCVTSFAAIFLHTYEVAFAEGEGIPEIDLTRPWLGIASAKGEESGPWIDISLRSEL